MWCRFCNYETNKRICPRCKNETVEEIPTAVYWCSNCKIPIIKRENQADKLICPLCKSEVIYLSQDLRPVFPEERLLLELLLEKKTHEFAERSVWCENSRYYIDGKAIALSSDIFKNADTAKLSIQLEEGKERNSYDYFNSFIAKFITANLTHLNEIKDKANAFINNIAKRFTAENKV